MTSTELRAVSNIVFLALTIWREARGESVEARTAVGYCVMNRVMKPSWWGKDVQSVLFKKWQFSSLTDPNDKQLVVWPERSTETSWIECLEIADNVYHRRVKNPAPGADTYHDISIETPVKWKVQPDQFIRQIGRIKFFNLDRDVEKELPADGATSMA